MRKKHISIIGGYLILTVVMTWPTILHLTDGIPGDGFDGWQNYWNLWWVKESILVLESQPFFTTYLYPPAGTNLLFHTLNIFNGLWTLPLQLNFGLAVAYNSVVFLSFTLAGYGGYLLSRYTLVYLKPSGQGFYYEAAAFIGGIIFTMSPFHMAHLLGHMQVFSLIWPPFYILYLLRTLQPWSLQPRYRWHDAALSCLFLILATLVNWYHTLYLLIFTGLILLWVIVMALVKKENLRRLGQPILLVLGIGIGFGVILSPLLIPMVVEARARPDLQTGLMQNITLSADLLAYITPSELHPLWGSWARNIADNFTTTTSERLIFVGFVPLALSLWIILRRWQNITVKFWTFIIVIFFGLSLGPYLHIFGQIITIGDTPLPMPYMFLYQTVPFIGLTRSLSRYSLMVMLGLGILVSIALSQIKLKRFYGLAILLICFEFLAIPYPISLINIPPFYEELASDTEDYVIAELPMNWDRPTPLLHQTVHQKPLLTAYTSRDHPQDLARRTPVFQQWRFLGPDIIDQSLPAIAPTIFNDFNLRYIVLDYWQMPPGPEREATEKWVAAALPQAKPIYEDDRLKVYQAPDNPAPHPYLSLGQGWQERQENGETITRTFEDSAELFLHHPQNQPLELEWVAAAENPASITLLAEGTPLAEFRLTETFTPHQITLPPLSDEWVTLEFRLEKSSEEGGGAVMVQKITLRNENQLQNH